MKFKKLATMLSTLSLIMAILLPSVTYAIQSNPNAGKGEQGYWCYRTVTPGFENNNESSLYDFYTMVSPKDEESIVYCYNAGQPQPVIDKEQAEKECTFERFGFYEGMTNLGTDRGNEEKINTIAAILMAGYPNDGLGKAMDDYAKECFNQIQDRTYSFEDFKREMTQRAIWKADKPRGTYTDGYPYAEALYNYGISHPLNEETAYADTLTFKTKEGQQIDQTHPLIIEETTLKSELFTIDNYDGVVTIESLGSNLMLIDNETKQETTAIEKGRYYYIEATNQDVDSTKMDMKYMRMANSYFYQYVTSPFPLGMQNMVQAAITHKQMPLSIKMKESSESSDTSSESTSSMTSSSDAVTSDTTDEANSDNSNSSESTVDSSIDTAHESTSSMTSSSDAVTSDTTDEANSDSSNSSENTVDSSVDTAHESTSSTTSSNDAVMSDTTDEANSDSSNSSESSADSSIDTAHESTSSTISSSDVVTSESTEMTSMGSTMETTETQSKTEKIMFSKVDPNGNFVEGANLTLKDMTTKQEENFVSTKSVKELIVHYNHDYVLSETHAPTGYQLAKPITFRLNQYGFIEVKQNGTYTANTRLCEVLQDEIVNGQHVLNDNTQVTVNLESNIAHTADCGHIDENGFKNEETMTYKKLKDKMNHLQMIDEFKFKGKEINSNISQDGNRSSNKGSLPTTGNQKNTILTIIGTVIVIGSIAGTIFIILKKNK